MRNIAARRECDKRWRAAHPERLRELWKRWAEQNPEKRHAANVRNWRKWEASNHQRRLESKRLWRSKNPEKQKARNLRRRVQLFSRPGHCSRKDWLAIFSFFEKACAYCALPLTDATATRDHVIPLFRDESTDWPHNNVPACSRCNSSKGGSNLIPWMAKRAYSGLDMPSLKTMEILLAEP